MQLHRITHGVFMLLVMCSSACTVVGKHTTPQRPTVSSDTKTTAAGSLEIEAGVTHDPGDSLDLPIQLKYGIDDRSEVYLAFSPFRFADRPGDDGHGIGDLAIGARHRFVEETQDGPAIAGSAYVKLPTADADEGLGSGEVDVGFAGAIEKNIDRFDLVGFAQLDFLGDQDGGIDFGQTLAFAGSTPLDERWGVLGELSGIFVPDRHVDAVQFLAGTTYTVRPDLVFDAALGFGLTDDAPDFVLIFGFTHNFGDVALP